jgi:hypothetical protein
MSRINSCVPSEPKSDNVTTYDAYSRESCSGSVLDEGLDAIKSSPDEHCGRHLTDTPADGSLP